MTIRSARSSYSFLYSSKDLAIYGSESGFLFGVSLTLPLYFSKWTFGLTTPGARGLVSTSEATGSCSSCGSWIVL